MKNLCVLCATFATFAFGCSATFAQATPIGLWRNVKETLSWTINVPTPGRFHVILRAGCPATDDGSEFAVVIGKATLKATVKESANWDSYRESDLGIITITQAGEQQLVIQPLKKVRSALMNFNRLVLKPE